MRRSLPVIILLFSTLCSTAQTSATDYFRSIASGNWATPSIWESSPDGISWIVATLTPTSAAKTITIQNSVTVSTSVTVDEVIIANGGTLVNAMTTGNILTINNGTGTDIDIQSGGIYHITSTLAYSSYQSITAGATFRIRSGGMIRVGTGGATGANNSSLATTAGSYVWEDGAIFDWNTTTPYATNVTYFPDAGPQMSIFRVSANTGTITGGLGTNTDWHGIFEAATNVTINGGGNKYFRNGFQGAGTIDASNSNGQFKITGGTAILGGGTLIAPGFAKLGIGGGSQVTMISDKLISGSVDMTANNSHIILGNYNLTISAGTVSIQNISSWVTTNGTGKLTLKNFTSGYIPVGLSTVNPLFVTNGGAADYSVRVVEPVVPSIYDPTRTVLRTWYVTASSNQLPDLGFGYTFPTDCGVNFLNSNCVVAAHPNAVWNVYQSGISPSPYIYAGTYVVTADNIPFFTNPATEIPFAVANNGAVLPLDYFITARAQRSNGSGLINWQVYETDNVFRFEIQKSNNNGPFRTIGTIEPHTGQDNYSFTDPVLEKGKNQYRIKVTHLNGSNHYSNTVLIFYQSDGFFISSLLPNPVRDKAALQVAAGRNMKLQLQVMDATGRLRQVRELILKEGNNEISLDFINCPSGIYHLILSGEEGRQVYRIARL